VFNLIASGTPSSILDVPVIQLLPSVYRFSPSVAQEYVIDVFNWTTRKLFDALLELDDSCWMTLSHDKGHLAQNAGVMGILIFYVVPRGPNRSLVMKTQCLALYDLKTNQIIGDHISKIIKGSQSMIPSKIRNNLFAIMADSTSVNETAVTVYSELNAGSGFEDPIGLPCLAHVFALTLHYCHEDLWKDAENICNPLLTVVSSVDFIRNFRNLRMASRTSNSKLKKSFDWGIRFADSNVRWFVKFEFIFRIFHSLILSHIDENAYEKKEDLNGQTGPGCVLSNAVKICADFKICPAKTKQLEMVLKDPKLNWQSMTAMAVIIDVFLPMAKACYMLESEYLLSPIVISIWDTVKSHMEILNASPNFAAWDRLESLHKLVPNKTKIVKDAFNRAHSLGKLMLVDIRELLKKHLAPHAPLFKICRSLLPHEVATYYCKKRTGLTSWQHTQ